ncbi:hypothetical protein [Brochothrix phage ADU4]|nr:hypothetical protein [Brochothrix phage ADU4]
MRKISSLLLIFVKVWVVCAVTLGAITLYNNNKRK